MTCTEFRKSAKRSRGFFRIPSSGLGSLGATETKEARSVNTNQTWVQPNAFSHRVNCWQFGPSAPPMLSQNFKPGTGIGNQGPKKAQHIFWPTHLPFRDPAKGEITLELNMDLQQRSRFGQVSQRHRVTNFTNSLELGLFTRPRDVPASSGRQSGGWTLAAEGRFGFPFGFPEAPGAFNGPRPSIAHRGFLGVAKPGGFIGPINRKFLGVKSKL